MKLQFQLSDTVRKHVARHFGSEQLAGSHFLTSTFASPDDPLAYINSTAPNQIIIQSTGKSAYCFSINDGRMAGTSGLALRDQLPALDIVREIREGFILDIGLVKELPLTIDFCVIAQESTEGLSVITAFPGGYARPFAQKKQPAVEYALNKQFWEEHVLLRKKT